jgi:hypothetical protein
MNSLGHACRRAPTASARVDPATSAKDLHHERRSTPSAMPYYFSLFRTCPQLGGTRKLAAGNPDFAAADHHPGLSPARSAPLNTAPAQE